MTNPYLTAPLEQRIADEVLLQGLRARIVEAIDFAKKLHGTDSFIGDRRFLNDTLTLLDEALESQVPMEGRIQEGLARNGNA